MTSGPNYYYTWTQSRPGRARVTTSRTELINIAIAYLVLTVDFLLVFVFIFYGVGPLYSGTAAFLSRISLPLVETAAGAALTGFLFHELAHKVVAQRYGFWAEFRMSVYGLIFSLFTSTFGFLFAAPGATVVSGMSEMDREHWGLTSLAGPASNLGFAAIFYVSSVVAYFLASPYFILLLFLTYINGWFAAFNLIPFGPLDGAKVRRWNGGAWVVMMVVSAAIAGFSYFATFVYQSPFFHL